MPKFPSYKAGDVVFVKTEFVDGDLTPDRVYKCIIERDGHRAGNIITDSGRVWFILFEHCAFLDRGNWEILPEKISKYYDRFGQLPPKELMEELCLE